MSPGNPEVSKPLEPGQGGAQKSSSDSAGEGRSSGKGSPAKGKTGERRSSGKGSPAKEKKIT